MNRIKELVDYLNKCNKAYDEGNPIISDKEYDDLYFELKKLEEETGLILSNSPTQNIIYEVVNALNKVEHSHKMLSLDKTKSTMEVMNFVGNHNFLLMCKMDGLTCSLTYRDGKLVSAETRGNGLIGEDILHNAKVLPSIPKTIPYMNELVIDGEIICTYNDFEEFSNEYKNPRNFAAGSIRLLDAKECASRKLTFVAWDVITTLYSEDGIEYRLDQKLDVLDSFGFVVVPYYNTSGSLLTEKIFDNIVDMMKDLASTSSYPIDGLVFKFNDCAYGRSLGETTHHFKNALAYKFYDETYPTELIAIDWTMGRTGVLTPVAVFKPIEIDGSIVEKASLHNVSILKELCGGTPKVGDTVYIYKANQIIPQIDAWENGIGEEIRIPEVCPICGEPAILKTDIESTVLFCNNSACEGKLINKLEHFCGKKGLDIKGISKATLEKLIDWGWISDYTDIFELAQYKQEWTRKAGFGAKSVDKILSAIETSRECELHQFIAALGIPLIGSTAAKELAKHFNSWDSLISAVENNFSFYTLPNFGTEMHNSIIKFNYTEAKLIADHYITFKFAEKSEELVGTSLSGKTFVITGKVNHFKNRDEIKALIESLGGKVTGSVSKNTDYLINNDVSSNSSKNVTAKSLGISILSEEDFIQTFNIG